MNAKRAELLEKMALDGATPLEALHTVIVAYNLLYLGYPRDGEIDYASAEKEAREILAARKGEEKE